MFQIVSWLYSRFACRHPDLLDRPGARRRGADPGERERHDGGGRRPHRGDLRRKRGHAHRRVDPHHKGEYVMTFDIASYFI